jgi:hypothetical protein
MSIDVNDLIPRGTPLEPNAFDGRSITPALWTDLVDFLLDQARYGRTPGLLPSPTNRPNAVLRWKTPDLLALDAILAVGENGHPLVVPPDAEPRIRPLSLEHEPEGDHAIYACLAAERVSFGEPVVARPANGTAPARRPRWRARRVVLAKGGDAADHLDRLQVGIVARRAHAGGHFTNAIDTSFHPPVTDLAAYRLPNPLVRLAARGLEAVRELGPERGPLRRELTLLGNVAERGRPEVAMLQAQRCIGLLREARLDSLELPEDLEQRAWDPRTFTAFLGRLAQTLEDRAQAEPFPIALEIDSGHYLRAEEQVRPDDAGFFRWKAPAGFHAGELAIYFPRAVRGELPNLTCGRNKQHLDRFRPWRQASPLSRPGVAMRLDGLEGALEGFYLKVTAGAEFSRLEQHLGDGHAVYYRGGRSEPPNPVGGSEPWPSSR